MSEQNAIQQSLAPELEALNARIRKQLGSNSPLMDTVVDTFLRKKGKQLRPIVVILTAKMLGQANDNTLAAAAAVELLHNASLIHDDVIDNSMTRRGEPTINSIWDNHIAVLVGDFFVSSAMQQAIATGDIRVIDSLCYLGKLLSLGELDQIYNARHHRLSEEAYYHTIEYKTASLFVACAKMGCATVGADDAATERMSEFARLMGLCFQMRDDIYDYYSDDIGKPTGNDLREGKITLPLLHALLTADDARHTQMLDLATKEMLSDSEIATLTAYAIEQGGIDYAYDRMADLRQRAAAILATFPRCEASQGLMAIFDQIVARPIKI